MTGQRGLQIANSVIELLEYLLDCFLFMRVFFVVEGHLVLELVCFGDEVIGLGLGEEEGLDDGLEVPFQFVLNQAEGEQVSVFNSTQNLFLLQLVFH